MIKSILKVFLVITSPFTFLAAAWLKFVKKAGTGKVSDTIFMQLGILPVPDHYYHPMINPGKHLTKSLRDDRNLPGIDLNTEEQVSLLSKFHYSEELLKFPLEKTKDIEFFYNNKSYCSGDAEYLYNMVRHFKPGKIVEIGSGHSTLMVKNAVKQNKLEDPNYILKHVCIEPYEQPWLDKIDVELIREKVESVNKSVFEQLGHNDILFIDSSHIIRPQGDVLFEFLEILPIIKPGVIVHVHDIFTPKDYLNEWIFDEHLFWNEQYLLEAFLTSNAEFKIIGATNYLSHHYRTEFAAKCPIFAQQAGREPGAFWMVKN